jgi:hypothetical protein
VPEPLLTPAPPVTNGDHPSARELAGDAARTAIASSLDSWRKRRDKGR